MAAGTNTRRFSKRYFPTVKVGGTLRKNFCSFCVPLVKVYPKQRYSANNKNGGKKMEIQDKAMRMLRGLKGAGISYKEFAEKTGISLD
jgi:hypothetical protein